MCVNHGVHVCTILHLCVPVCAVFVTLCFNVGFNMPVFFYNCFRFGFTAGSLSVQVILSLIHNCCYIL